MRLPLAAVMAATLTAAACTGTVRGPGSSGTPPPGTPGPEELSATASEAFARAVAVRVLADGGERHPSAGQIADVEEGLFISKAVRAAGVAFALASASAGPGSEELFVAMTPRGDGWQVEDAAPLAGHPPRGSNAFLFQTLAVAGVVGHGGFVDPSASSVDAVDPFGQVVDADEPLAGASVVVSDRFGLLRVHRGGRVIGALQIVITTAAELALLQPARIPGRFRADARAVADRFVRALLSRGWDSATNYYNPDGRPDLLLPPLGRILHPGTWRVTGRPTPGPRGFAYSISGPDGQALLHLQVILHLGEWKVTGCALSTPPDQGPIG